MTHIRIAADYCSIAETIDFDPVGRFHPCLTWHSYTTLAEKQAVLTTLATGQRWRRETGGLDLPNGLRIATTKADQDRITSVIVNAETAGVTTVDFKAASGWASLTIAEIRGIASAVALHVQACFSAERAHHEAIAALPSVSGAEAYDVAAGWPA